MRVHSLLFQFIALTLIASGAVATAQVTSAGERTSRGSNDPIARIRDEGLNRSKVMDTLGHLTEVIGPRLTGSPQMKRANEWTKQKLESWGLTNAQLDPWGPFGRGWTLKRYSAQVVEPFTFPVVGHPKAWSPGLDEPIEAPVVYLKDTSSAALEKHKGKLKGAIVLSGAPRKIETRFDAAAVRMNETNLLRLANAGDGRSFLHSTDVGSRSSSAARTNNEPPARSAETNIASRASTRTNQAPASSSSRLLDFLIDEGAAVLVTASSRGDGGPVFVQSASVPQLRTTNSARQSVAAHATNAPATVPQITISPDDYNRMTRMIEAGEKLKMAVELKVAFNDDGIVQENTIAEIPGTDLKEEIVMVGAHMDSWHAGTGATDNAAGVAAAMEAVRIIRALDLKPRRTIRIALWSGEEQGLLG